MCGTLFPVVMETFLPMLMSWNNVIWFITRIHMNHANFETPYESFKIKVEMYLSLFTWYTDVPQWIVLNMVWPGILKTINSTLETWKSKAIMEAQVTQSNLIFLDCSLGLYRFTENSLYNNNENNLFAAKGPVDLKYSKMSKTY